MLILNGEKYTAFFWWNYIENKGFYFPRTASLFSRHRPVFQISLLLYFLSDMAATRQQCPSLSPAEWWNSLWWKRWPIKHRFYWWHNRKNGFFSKTVPRPLFTPSDESSLVPHEDADFLTRCEGHDSQIIWLKQRRRFYCDLCAFQWSVTMWSAARQLERKKKAIFTDHN